MKRFKLLLIVILLFGVQTIYSQEKTLPVNLSVIYPVSINTSKSDNANINIGIIGSNINSLKGFGVNGIYSVLEGDLKGIQINGVYSETRKKLKGAQLSVGINALTEGGSGLMLGGIGNIVFDEFSGIQLSGISNLAFESVKGMQIAGLYNLAGKDINILQFGLAGNVVGREMKGLQVSGLFNLAAISNKGAQVSSINLTKAQNGLQFGFINACDNNEGLQFGILNVVGKKQNGTTIGLLNAFPDSKVQLLLGSGNLAYATIGARFKTNGIYTSLIMGAPVVISNTSKSILFNYNLGYSLDLKYLNINTDLGFTHISNESNQVENKSSKNQFGITLKAGLEKQILNKLGIFVNGGFLYLADSYKSPTFSNKFIIEGGFTLL